MTTRWIIRHNFGTAAEWFICDGHQMGVWRGQEERKPHMAQAAAPHRIFEQPKIIQIREFSRIDTANFIPDRTSHMQTPCGSPTGIG